MGKIRWGVFSTANIGIEKVIPAMQQSEFCEIVAIASSRIEKAQAAAMKLGIPKAYGSYEELLNAPEIDAVSGSFGLEMIRPFGNLSKGWRTGAESLCPAAAECRRM